MPLSTNDTILKDGGECGALLRAIDWTVHPLGVPSAWPPELRTLVGVMLGSVQPMLILWGPQHTVLYNDSYAAMCGDRHPEALGRPFQQLWFDIWNEVLPIIDAAYAGRGTSMDDIEFTMHRKGYPEETHFAFSYTPVRNSEGRIVGIFCACQETTSEVLMRRRELQERERFLQVFELTLGAIAVLSGPDHVITVANADYQMLVGRRDIVGKPVSEALPEVVNQGFVELLDEVYRSGVAHLGRGTPVKLQRKPGGAIEQRIIDFLYQPLRDLHGQVDAIFVHAIDVTERIEADQQQSLLRSELGHRMKNQLALVQAIVNQTLRTAPDIPTAAKSLGDRVQVLAGAHDLLIAGETGSATVGEIVRKLVRLHDDGAQSRFRLSGETIEVASRPALSLSLILHELSTNAVKYGALSGGEGYVKVGWGRQDSPEGERFVLDWEEVGGPPVSVPRTVGSGSRLIRAGLAGTIDGKVALEFAPQGVRCTISADLESFQLER
ncbi:MULTISPECIES: HWE histidine kinase domain-containing protein [unclassified Devosia]|uniref:sensor histidine kinase n=1 Tax=unclassified Devosia TaxID=196773 RepID=UPI001553762C|nr:MULTISPECIES: HWE histidine kinase domain-containing protein [unclassified Devosia]